MTFRPNHRYAVALRRTRGVTLLALALCAAMLGCGEERTFEARRTPRLSRTAPRHDDARRATSIPEHEATPNESTPIDAPPSEWQPVVESAAIAERRRNCSPDAVLTAGESIAQSGPAFAGPSAAAPSTTKPSTTKPSIARPTTTEASAIVTLAELDSTTTSQRQPRIGVQHMSDLATPSVASPGDAAALVRQAEDHNRRGLTFAAKGAVFSARKEFHEALRTTAAALDAVERSQRHSSALTSGLSALTEMGDFAAVERTADGDVDIAAVIAGHKSQAVPVEVAAGMAVSALQERYLDFAVERLAFAAASPTGSVALHRLGKASLIGSPTKSSEARTKARVLLEAALLVDANNFPAANDLAVHLAEDGYYDRAIGLLRDGLTRSPQPALWTNLASIHDLRGEAQLAQAARLEARSLMGRPAGGVLPTHNVAWVDARTFAAASQPNTEIQTATKGPASAAPRAAAVGLPLLANASPVQRSPVSQAAPQRQPISTANSLRRSAMVQ